MLIKETLISLKSNYLMKGQLNLSFGKRKVLLAEDLVLNVQDLVLNLRPSVLNLRPSVLNLCPSVCFKSDLIPLKRNNKLIK